MSTQRRNMMAYRQSGGGGYDTQYLTIEMLAAGTQTFKIATELGTAHCVSVSYSTDGGSTWTTTNNAASTLVTITTPQLAIGDKVLWKGTACKYATYSSNNDQYSSKFVLTDNCIVYGNIASMLYGDAFSGKTGWGYYNGTEQTTPSANSNYGMSEMFYGCTGLQSAENLVFPFTSYPNNTFVECFRSCTSLTITPSLPCTTLANNCYFRMFYGCSALVTAPTILPATTLVTSCYNNMFYYCSALTTAPVLPAETLVSNCYQQMFQNCSHLNYVKAMFTTTPATGVCYNWLNGVAASGTFVKNSAATWADSVTYGVPSGWSVELADS